MFSPKALLGKKRSGTAVCVYADGQKVVDLWGGYCDEARSQPWQADTIVCMFSVAKGMAALCAHVLADRGTARY